MCQCYMPISNLVSICLPPWLWKLIKISLFGDFVVVRNSEEMFQFPQFRTFHKFLQVVLYVKYGDNKHSNVKALVSLSLSSLWWCLRGRHPQRSVAILLDGVMKFFTASRLLSGCRWLKVPIPPHSLFLLFTGSFYSCYSAILKLVFHCLLLLTLFLFKIDTLIIKMKHKFLDKQTMHKYLSGVQPVQRLNKSQGFWKLPLALV